MPNKPKHPPFNVRVPKELADEFRDIAEKEGVRPGELLTELLRGRKGKYEELRKRNGGRPLGQRRRIADVLLSPLPQPSGTT